MSQSLNFHWFRRDLRLHDNASLYAALNSGKPVQSVFIFDKTILNRLENKNDARVSFLHDTLTQLDFELQKNGGKLWIEYGTPIEVWKKLARENKIETVFCNRDYEPLAIGRDNQVMEFLADTGIKFKQYKDQVIFEHDEVVKDDGKPYTVYTPFGKKWRKRYALEGCPDYKSEKLLKNINQTSEGRNWTLEEIGFTRSSILIPAYTKEIEDYNTTRDVPSLDGTSKLGPHLRFGTVSVRRIASYAEKKNDTFFGELIWREFFMQILWHFPNVVTDSFKSKYEGIKWLNNEAHFEKWCKGETGYPFVDAGMRELNATGHMHNRARMITASFLVKHLLIDWRWGEAYFAAKLNDFELSSNNGN
ncbi:MAG: deoxyribodipyrimidine photo-lyase, partial [Limisphaerales bacterium]